ncbi:hypothetical protein D9613_010077 [Agrocybe pediades]|uniref:Major facilitator superfamily (MFS) profile domain-containing protein n=1 Tax=Agrocybe pediades TaxID=84607 RepID=A0A8H4QZ70_9AGAR|nr:hypothetical protein D9613_010077 [Agrocybe pediades]
MSSGVESTPDYEEKVDRESIVESSSLKHVPGVPLATPEEERLLVRKLDKRLLPLTCLLYLFSSLDRSNIGNARLQGLPEDVLGGDKTGVLFDWLSSGFYFSYILFQIPATLLSKLCPPRVYVALAAIGWGLTSTLMATAFNFPGIMIARLFLGVFEAGFGPVITIYLSFFYTRYELGLRLAMWFGFSTVAGAFGGLIAFGVQHIQSSVADWRLLFVIEGVPTVILGIATYFLLPNRPESTTYLTERERQIAIERMNRDQTGDVYLAGVIYFGLHTAIASLGPFLPTIIATFGFGSNAITQLLTVPPYALAGLSMVSCSYTSDRIQNRGVIQGVFAFVGAIGYLILLFVPNNNGVRYFATFLITSGAYSSGGIIIAWFNHNLGSETKKATGIPLFMAIGQCGSVLGTHLFPKTEGPRYIKGFAVVAGFLVLSGICTLILSLLYAKENARRDRLFGKPVRGMKIDTDSLADETPEFRYVP